MSNKNYTYSGWAYEKTVQSQEILNALLEGKKAHRAMMIIANTGLGKSGSCSKFLEKESKHTYRITVGDSWRPIHLVDAIMSVFGIVKNWKNTENSINRKLRAIADKLVHLKNAGARVQIIIDEAENLKPAFLKMIKELHDAIIEHCSYTLIGTPYLLESLLNSKQKNRMSVPQLHRRLKAGTRLITDINKARDFAPFFKRHIDPYKDVQDLVLEYADNYGELHDYLDPFLQHCHDNDVHPSGKLFRFFHQLK